MEKQNSATRLYEFVKVLVDSNKNLGVLVSEFFGIDKNDKGRLLIGLATVLQELAATKQAIARIPNIDHDLYIRPLGALETAFSAFNLQASTSQLKAAVGPDVLTGLQFCADTLRRYEAEDTVDAEELKKITRDCQNLSEKVTTSQIPEPLKIALLDILDSFRSAVALYRIRGSKGLEEAMDRALGSLLRRPDLVNRTSRGTEQGDVVQGIFRIVERVNALVSLAKNISSLIGFGGVAALISEATN